MTLGHASDIPIRQQHILDSLLPSLLPTEGYSADKRTNEQSSEAASSAHSRLKMFARFRRGGAANEDQQATEQDEQQQDAGTAPPSTESSTAAAALPALQSPAAASKTPVEMPTSPVADPALAEEDDGERGDLEQQVRTRDASISGLEKTRLEKHQELAALQKELEEERLRQMKEAILHRIEVERLKRQTKAVEERLEALEKDMHDKDAIHEYANLIKGVAPKGGVDSQYVMKLQSQLAKAVKKMDATAHQMVQVEQSCEEVVNSLKKEISDIVEDRCRTELELRKQLELLEEQKAEMQAEYDERIQENQRELGRLKDKASSTVTTSIADLEAELEETESKLEQLNNIHQMQERNIEELNQNLDNDPADALDN